MDGWMDGWMDTCRMEGESVVLLAAADLRGRGGEMDDSIETLSW